MLFYEYKFIYFILGTFIILGIFIMFSLIFNLCFKKFLLWQD